ncbi:MAG TPA: hypothetical protein VE992_07325 [Solirubrobacteraceae bacterium]|nr:hypothetical protein [Solirubrobacteraceae bacterium]
MRRLIVVALALCGLALAASAASARVLLVGSFHGIRGQFRTLQAAVNAARPGDWILIGPGDYKTHASRRPRGRSDLPAAVLVTKRGLHIRGMNRNTVIIDGTRRGAPCNRLKRDQNFGPRSKNGPMGLNGIMVWKADKVSIENLTACNFLGGSGDTGNEIWWNGGDGSWKIGGWGYYGAFLNATSTFYDAGAKNPEESAAKYGIFSSDWSGGTWAHDYASNFNDSGFYVGACQQVCNQKLTHIWAEFSSLGYSGSNSGGKMLIEYSEFDHNKDGFDTNSQNGDNPPPQDGACPDGGISPITHTHSCWVFMHNYVHDNNNPNVPAQGLSAEGPVGTGMSVSGGRDDTLMDNTFANNDAWGVIFVPFLDSGPPCRGGTLTGGTCIYDEWGDALLNNTFVNNGSYGHPSNGDIGFLNFESGHPTSCFHGNHEPGGKPVTPAGAQLLQTTHPSCNGTPATTDSSDPQFLTEVLCNAQVSLGAGPPSCPNGQYPRFTHAQMHPLPTRRLKSMPNPCAGVPNNPWCRGGRVRRA